MLNRYLTKSRFKIGCECPTKLFYTAKKEYANNNLDNEFLQALAEGGYQVGELAKLDLMDGINIKSLDYNKALIQTQKELKKDFVILYEPAFLYKDLFVRVDLLVKNKDLIMIYEVKAKSYNSLKDSFFNAKRDGFISKWKPYLYDIAFQKYVVTNSLNDLKIHSYLVLTDKSAICTVDGLNQKFPISRNNDNRIEVNVQKLSDDDLLQNLLISVSVDDEINFIYENTIFEDTGLNFYDQINFLSDMYKKDEKIAPQIGAKCSKCEFKTDLNTELRSGFHECWKEKLNFNDNDFLKPLVLELWNYREKDNLISNGKYFLENITDDDFKNLESNSQKLTQQQRQYLQVKKVKENDDSVYFDKESLKNEIASWTFPLHCIDFETMANAIPFNKGLHPYENVAFQFSHHIIYEDGRIEHKGEYINTNQGEFPNFKFVRALKKELENDQGTIFRYSPHENTILKHIYEQLENSNELDKEELKEFILDITYNKDIDHIGYRNMVDLLELVKWYYYDPNTHGSNSIKYVLPAIINRSTYLQAKYSKPIYGTAQLPSKNFNDFVWIQKDQTGNIKDPYKLLPKIFEDINEVDEQKLLMENEELRNGAAAMTAYAKMQFTHMSEYEKNAITKALLKYCELDTFAMVLILESWINDCKGNKN